MLHRLVELASYRQRQHVERSTDSLDDRLFIRCGWTSQDPWSDLVATAWMTNAHPQSMEAAVTEVSHDVAQTILAAVATVELQARSTGRQIQVIVSDQALLRLDLVVAQRRSYSDAALVHEGGRLEQPHGFAGKAHAAGLAVQFAVESEALAVTARQSVN